MAPPQPSSAPSRLPLQFCAALGLAGALLVAPRWAHIDDVDAQLYQVVARHMVDDSDWFNLRYLGDVMPRFREHLPFGLWPYAAAITFAGDGAVWIPGLIFSIATLIVLAWVAKRMRGWLAALVALTILGCTESFFLYGARPRLDPALIFFSLAATAPWLLNSRRRSAYGVSAALAAMAVLIKGPFGVAPLCAVAAARAILDRRPGPLLAGAATAAGACLPLALFLLVDLQVGDGSWWHGYGQNQLLDSAMGARRDGSSAWLFPVASVLQRFWPGLPLVALGLFEAARRGWRRGATSDDDTAGSDPRKLLALSSLLLLGALCVPGRKVWNHTLVAYPMLALLAASALDPHLRKLRDRVPGPLRLALLPTLAGCAWILAFTGIGRHLVPPPCVASQEFQSHFDPLPAGASVLVVAPTPSWATLASLAAERRLEGRPSEQLPPADEARGVALALVSDASPVGVPPHWRLLGSARGWRLLQPVDDTQ